MPYRTSNIFELYPTNAHTKVRTRLVPLKRGKVKGEEMNESKMTIMLWYNELMFIVAILRESTNGSDSPAYELRRIEDNWGKFYVRWFQMVPDISRWFQMVPLLPDQTQHTADTADTAPSPLRRAHFAWLSSAVPWPHRFGSSVFQRLCCSKHCKMMKKIEGYGRIYSRRI